MNKRKSLAHIRALIKARGREAPSSKRDKEPPLDPIEALQHIKTLARAAQDSIDIDIVQEHLTMILTMVDKAMPKAK
jgi:hypothetical protein